MSTSARAAVARTSRPGSPLAATLVIAVALLAWAMLALWNASPYGRYLDHGGWLDAAWFAAICSVTPQGELIVPALTHTLAWLLMIAAMMLPTTLPLLGLFGRITADRDDATRLRVLVVAGYAVAWMLFGVAAHALDRAVHLAATTSEWFLVHGWVIGAAVLAIAGAFQFSDLKYRCLERCRMPLGFLNEHWRGTRPDRESFRIGFDHGLFCVGCCWALMLLMFVVGMGNLGWMLLIGLVTAAEKNLPSGKRLSAPLGLALLGSAAVAVGLNV